MFCWEDDRAPAETRLVTLDKIAAYEELHALIPPVQHPEAYVTALKERRTLPNIYNTKEQLINIAVLRLLQWKKYYKGAVLDRGKVTFVKFGADKENYRQLEDFKEALFS